MDCPKKMHWTTREVALVCEYYPRGGVDACLPHLQRSRSSIYQRACAMKLRAPRNTGARQSWLPDPEIDERIKLLHQHPMKRSTITEFAARIGRPRWWVSRRARDLGLKTPRFKELPWSQEEIDLLHDTAHLGSAAASRRLKARGYKRSATAVVVKRKREGIRLAIARQDAGIYNANQISDLLGVDNKTVTRWINVAGLKGALRGDMWCVKEQDLREFVIDNPYLVELRKIPDSSRAWFIELLGRRAA